MAIRKDAFARIGGYDEDFVGWGGEDNEFYDRCTVLSRNHYGYIPFVHLWHTPQEKRSSGSREQNLDFLEQRLAVPGEQRIRELTRQRRVASGA